MSILGTSREASAIRRVLVRHPRGALDLDAVLRSRERRGRGLARHPWPADRLEEILEARGRYQPEHHELVIDLVDDLVLDLVAEEACRRRHPRVTHTLAQ